ncbi:hypothetical protein [Streptomyces sp. MMS24-I29]|uniref:hypothetical protein n=1 Tax=Streptomyces sp. MMS24-I29 TaxID=3351480 RepID=UPI003C7A1D75
MSLATKRAFGRIPRRTVGRFTERHHPLPAHTRPRWPEIAAIAALIRAAAALWPIRTSSRVLLIRPGAHSE